MYDDNAEDIRDDNYGNFIDDHDYNDKDSMMAKTVMMPDYNGDIDHDHCNKLYF